MSILYVANSGEHKVESFIATHSIPRIGECVVVLDNVCQVTNIIHCHNPKYDFKIIGIPYDENKHSCIMQIISIKFLSVDEILQSKQV